MPAIAGKNPTPLSGPLRGLRWFLRTGREQATRVFLLFVEKLRIEHFKRCCAGGGGSYGHQCRHKLLERRAAEAAGPEFEHLEDVLRVAGLTVRQQQLLLHPAAWRPCDSGMAGGGGSTPPPHYGTAPRRVPARHGWPRTPSKTGPQFVTKSAILPTIILGFFRARTRLELCTSTKRISTKKQ